MYSRGEGKEQSLKKKIKKCLTKGAKSDIISTR
jgi:hypothetical protein